MKDSKNSGLELAGSHLDNCPPKGVVPISGYVYCWVYHDPPIEDDFIPAMKRWRNTHRFSPERKCQGYGLSVYRNMNDLLEAATTGLPDSRKIAEAKLTNIHGVIKSTPSNNSLRHFTWWPSRGMDVSFLFKIIRH